MGLFLHSLRNGDLLTSIFELNRGRKGTLSEMEGIRGLAVLLVFIVHFNSVSFPWLSQTITTSPFFSAITDLGHSGVDLFFALSGFLIYGGVLRAKSFNLKRYSAHRVRRIFPTYLTVLFVYLGLYFTVFNSNSPLPESSSDVFLYLASNILLIPEALGFEYTLTVAWTLTFELGFYIFVPLCVWGFKLRDRERKTRLCFLFTLTAALFVYFSITPGPERVVMFLCGALVYEIHDSKLFVVRPGLGMFACFIGALAIALHKIVGLPLMWMMLALYLGIGLFILEAVSSTSRYSRWLLWTPLRYLGNMSYSYYLAHGLFLHASMIGWGLLFPANSNALMAYFPMLVFSFLVTLVGSAILFVLVEKRFSLAG